ncbi:MAG: hypothetical protein ACRELE_08785 [Gemmatimonadales bacterium]
MTTQFVVTYTSSTHNGDDGDPWIIPLNTAHTDSGAVHREPKPRFPGTSTDWDSTLTFTVEVDTNGVSVPSVPLHLAIYAVDSGGTGSDSLFGHYHTSATIRKPTGYLSDSTPTTGATPPYRATVIYTPGQYSEPIRLVISTPAADDTLRKHWTVGVPSLVHVSGTHLHVIGEDTPLGSRHPHAHFGLSAFVDALNEVAGKFSTAFAGHDLDVNDTGLKFGGKFDLDTLWHTASCQAHCEHRLGRSTDIDHLSDTARRMMIRWWESKPGRLYNRKELDHLHLRFWVGGS